MSNGPWVRCLLLSLCVAVALSLQTSPAERVSNHALAQRQNAPASPPLVDFQVYEPVLVPQSARCTELLMSHVFGFSYGKPFVGSALKLRLLYGPVITEHRQLYSTAMFLQSGYDELHRHEQRSPI